MISAFSALPAESRQKYAYSMYCYSEKGRIVQGILIGYGKRGWITVQCASLMETKRQFYSWSTDYTLANKDICASTIRSSYDPSHKYA
jgi:hypothetical protein